MNVRRAGVGRETTGMVVQHYSGTLKEMKGYERKYVNVEAQVNLDLKKRID